MTADKGSKEGGDTSIVRWDLSGKERKATSDEESGMDSLSKNRISHFLALLPKSTQSFVTMNQVYLPPAIPAQQRESCRGPDLHPGATAGNDLMMLMPVCP